MISNDKKLMLNLGCGQRYRNDWVNLDFVSSDKNVLACNLNNGIPYPNDYFEVIYHSHVLEHFTKKNAEKFIMECYRVLAPGGIIRVSVPDLEQINKNYTVFLNSAIKGDEMAKANYDWTMVEMYDQCVRSERGGEMKECFKQKDLINRDFIRERIGYFFDIITNYKSSGWRKTAKKILSEEKINSFRKAIKSITNIIPGEKNRRLGRFRTSGEIHQWMYDRFSLGRLLQKHGFSQVVQRTASDSYIKNWSRYNLDTEPDGTIYKADSLYMEAKK
jgi:predicted SAM-dependent methyltransferase